MMLVRARSDHTQKKLEIKSVVILVTDQAIMLVSARTGGGEDVIQGADPPVVDTLAAVLQAMVDDIDDLLEDHPHVVEVAFHVPVHLLLIGEAADVTVTRGVGVPFPKEDVETVPAVSLNSTCLCVLL